MTGFHALHTAVADEVARIRADDPLARITVIAPSFGSARDLVRSLAILKGTAGVAVRTADQVIAELSGPELAPRAALPFPLLAAAVDKALDAEPGRLAAVASEPVTGQAVARACLRLGTVDAGVVVPLTPLHGEVLRLAARAHATTGPAFYTEYEAVSVALERLDGLGHILLAAPLRGSNAERRLREALEQRGVPALPGTGVDHFASAAEPDTPEAVTGTHVLHASDPDDEVRAVVRFVRSRLVSGIPGYRIGVYYPSPDPYLRLLHRAFSEAGIAVYGPTDTGPGRSPAGRSLVRLLRLDADRMDRAELLSIVAEGAVVALDDRAERVSSRRLEQLTRTRFPVIGGDDWTGLAEVLRDEPDRLAGSDRAAAAALLRLIGQIRAGLESIDSARTWTRAATAVGELLTSLTRNGPDRAAVLTAVGSLADMDAVAPGITRERVAEAVATRLDAGTDRVGEEGAGVAIGPIDDAVGRDLDTICVVGMAEGLLPVLHRPDPLLPEGSVEPPATELLDERYRVLQAALATGTRYRLCSFPRGSMRGGGDRIPSRWLLPTLSRLAGSRVRATSWQADVDGCEQVTAIRSFVDGILDPPDLLGPDPATPAEFRLRSLAADSWYAGPDSPEQLVRAHEMRSARRLGRFSRFTGDVSEAADLLTVLDHPLSPTRLEDWAQSPYLFFLSSVLRVRVLDEPAEDIEMDLREHGELVHAILQRYIDGRITSGSGPDRDRLAEALQTESDAAVAGSPGLVASLWRRRQAVLAAELGTWFEQDSADAGDGWSPSATELEFGRAGDAGDVLRVPYEVTTSSGPVSLLLAGSIDRLDIRGGNQRVTDYKTGRAPAEDQHPTAEDPTLGGTRFQLPLYAAAAATAGGRPVAEVRYWYCTERGEFTRIGLPVTDEVMEKVRTDVGHLVDALQRGWFPLKGGRGSFRDLADLLGGADLDHTWKGLSKRLPISDHPAFAGILATDETEYAAEASE